MRPIRSDPSVPYVRTGYRNETLSDPGLHGPWPACYHRRVVNYRIAVPLGVLGVALCGGAVWWLASRDAGPREFTQQELQVKSSRLFEIAALLDPAAKAAALKSYLAENPHGPYLDMAYGLLLPAVAASDPKAAGELADQALERYTRPEHVGIRFRAYQFKLATLAQRRDPVGAAALAGRILERENDPELLRLAARFDPANAEAFSRKIAAGEELRRKTELAERSAKLVDLQPGQWEAMSEDERIGHLDRLLAKWEAAAANPDEFDRRPALRRLRISLLIQTGQTQRALAELDQIAARERGAWFYSAKAAALEKSGDREGGLREHINAFLASPNRDSWTRIEALSAQNGLSAADTASQLRARMASQAGVFPPFEFKTPEGNPLGLEDLRNDVILISFFFPG